MSNPISVRTKAAKAIPLGHAVDIGTMAQRLGLQAPVSVRQMSGQLDAIPGSKAYSQGWVTPPGTPLGGSVKLNINVDGTYTVEFITNSTGLASFDFQLRAYLTGPGLPSFFFYHAGHVSANGTDDTHPEPGSNPLIAMYWSEIMKSATFAVAHDYQWSGIVGTLDGLVHDLLSIGAATVGAFLGAVIGMTREAIGWLGLTLGPGGTLGVIAGVVVFAIGSIAGLGVGTALILGTVAGVAVGLVTNALIGSRSLNAAEIATARKVFGAELPYGDVMLTNLCGLGGRAFTAPGVDGKTYCNLGNAYNNPLGPGDDHYRGAGELLIHELTHAWQIAHNSFLPGFVCSGIVNQTHKIMGDSVYAYGLAGPPWTDFNLEQQGQIVNQWFSGTGNSQPWGAMNPTSPYYPYIARNILTGSAGYSTAWL